MKLVQALTAARPRARRAGIYPPLAFENFPTTSRWFARNFQVQLKLGRFDDTSHERWSPDLPGRWSPSARHCQCVLAASPSHQELSAASTQPYQRRSYRHSLLEVMDHLHRRHAQTVNCIGFSPAMLARRCCFIILQDFLCNIKIARRNGGQLLRGCSRGLSDSHCRCEQYDPYSECHAAAMCADGTSGRYWSSNVQEICTNSKMCHDWPLKLSQLPWASLILRLSLSYKRFASPSQESDKLALVKNHVQGKAYQN